jgi:ribonucleoside-triphosphate reductase
MTTPFGPLGQTVFDRTYSRDIPNGKKEQWSDTVARVVRGNTGLGPDQVSADEKQRLTEMINNLKLLPAGRHLWQTGTDGEQHSFNCHVVGWSEHYSDHMALVMSLLMVGSGVGSAYSADLIKTLPVLASDKVELQVIADQAHPDLEEISPQSLFSPAGAEVFKVKDSRAGWCDVLSLLLDTAEKQGGEVWIDVSEVRPRGAKIHGFGGTASGPGPLVKGLRDVAEVINGATGRQMNGIELALIDHRISEVIIAGGARRSARMSLMRYDDPLAKEFVRLKQDTADHWTSNFSLSVDDNFFQLLDEGDQRTTELFDEVIKGMATNGEPGFVNTSLASVGERKPAIMCNPCSEIWLESDNGAAEACCIGSINLAAFEHRTPYLEPELKEAAQLMTRFLLRATYADKVDQRVASIVDENRRIGVGITGFTEWVASHGLKWSEARHSKVIEAKLKELAEVVRTTADEYADELGCNRPIKTMAIAPTGSISLLAGVSAGMHPPFSRYFNRRIRFADTDPALQTQIAAGHHVEDDLYAANTKVVTIPCQDTILDKYPDHLIEQADEISVDDFMATQAFVQKYIDNAISFTVNLKDGIEQTELAAAVRKHLPNVKGITAFPDVSRPQSPYERITRDQYNNSMSGEVGQGFDEECASGACPIR